MFGAQLKKIVDTVEGGIGAVVMGLDGIPLDKYMAENKLDLGTIGVEFSHILGLAKKAGETLQIGPLDEFTVKAEQLTLVIRMLTDEYFLAVVLSAGGNFGKCRFRMRVVSPAIKAELV